MAPRRPGEQGQRTQRVVTAVVTAAYVAVPDWVEDPRRQRIVRWAVRGGSVATGVWSVRRAEAAEGRDPDRFLRSGYLVAAAVAVPTFVVAELGSHRVNARVVRALERRGVARPWTWVGLGSAAASLGLDALLTRWAAEHESREQP